MQNTSLIKIKRNTWKKLTNLKTEFRTDKALSFDEVINILVDSKNDKMQKL